MPTEMGCNISCAYPIWLIDRSSVLFEAMVRSCKVCSAVVKDGEAESDQFRLQSVATCTDRKIS